MVPWDSQDFSVGLQGQNNFYNNTKTLFASFYCVGICTDGVKAMVGKAVGVLT